MRIEFWKQIHGTKKLGFVCVAFEWAQVFGRKEFNPRRPMLIRQFYDRHYRCRTVQVLMASRAVLQTKVH